MNSHSNLPQSEEDNLLKRTLAKYMPYWPLFLCAIIAGVLGGFAFIKLSAPVYQAKATLLIKDEKKGNEESKMLESLNPISSKKIVENEIEVIQSRKLMREVADKLNLYTPVLEKVQFIYKPAYTSSPVTVITPDADGLQSTKENIPFAVDTAKREVTLDAIYKYPMNQVVQTPYGKLEFLLNQKYRPVSNQNEYFLSVTNPAELIPALMNDLSADGGSKLSSIIELGFKDTDPQRAIDILNQLIDSYRQSEINEKNLLASNTLSFVNDRLKDATSDLDSIQRKVQKYKSSSNAVDISTQGQLYLQNVSQNDQKLSEINAQISILNQVEGMVDNGGNYQGGIVSSAIGVGDPTLAQMLDKFGTLELEYEKGKATIGENNPKLLAIRDQITKIKPDILKNITTQKKSLSTLRDNITSSNNSYNSMLRGVPEKEKQLIDISRAQQGKQDIYSFLLQKKEESEIAYASTISDNRVIDYASVGNGPVSPNKLIIMAGFISLLLVLAYLFVNIRETMSGKIMYRKEIENATKTPVISEIAFAKLRNPIVIKYGKRSFIAEQFRKLRLSLSFSGIGTKGKRVLVTSSLSGEGKSFIAANLAVSETLMGKKVVLVDMDLNNPRQQDIFNTGNIPGVSEYLKGEKELKEVLFSLPEHKGLSLMVAGELPEDPAELLSSEKTTELIKALDKQFDIIIIDTSPMSLVTDGYMITNLCDLTLYVVRHGYTPKVLIKRFDENLKVNPIHNPHIIFNGVKQRSVLTNAYGYGYGYDYVYGKNNIYGKNNHKRGITS